MSKQENLHACIIGKKLKELRRSSGFSSYRTFAAELGVEPKHIWAIEEGRVDFKLSSLVRILKFYDISMSDFFKDIDWKKEQ